MSPLEYHIIVEGGASRRHDAGAVLLLQFGSGGGILALWRHTGRGGGGGHTCEWGGLGGGGSGHGGPLAGQRVRTPCMQAIADGFFLGVSS